MRYVFFFKSHQENVKVIRLQVRHQENVSKELVYKLIYTVNKNG